MNKDRDASKQNMDRSSDSDTSMPDSEKATHGTPSQEKDTDFNLMDDNASKDEIEER